MPESDAALSGDTSTSLELNYQWRSLIAAALNYYQSGEGTLGLDNEDKLIDFLEDLYD